MTVKPVTLQSLETMLGNELAIRCCAPLSFYMLLKANGYLPDDLQPDTFCFELSRTELGTTNADWSRPALTRLFRKKYSAPIISWQVNGTSNPLHIGVHSIERMLQAGYLASQKDISFFQKHIEGHDISEIVRAGYPVIVTMKPGFGTPDNSNIHSLILIEWQGGRVTVVDPDARNTDTVFDEKRVRDYISFDGGGTVVLPRG